MKTSLMQIHLDKTDDKATKRQIKINPNKSVKVVFTL